MKRIFKIDKGTTFNSDSDNLYKNETGDAMEFIESCFDDEKYLDKSDKFKKSHKIIVEVK